MTIPEFIANLEEYYGEYRPAVRAVAIQWLQSKKPPAALLSKLYAQVVLQCSSQYRTPPDVAVMKPMLEQLYGEMEHEFLTAATCPRLPDASEVVGREQAESFMDMLMGSIAKGRDPRQDEEVISFLESLGVAHQVDTSKTF